MPATTHGVPSTSTSATARRGTAAAAADTLASRSRARGPWTAITARPRVTSSPPMAATTRAVFEAFGITSKRSSPTHHTMMSSTTEASSGSSRWVYCVRPGRDLPQVVRERRLQPVEAAGHP